MSYSALSAAFEFLISFSAQWTTPAIRPLAGWQNLFLNSSVTNKFGVFLSDTRNIVKSGGF